MSKIKKRNRPNDSLHFLKMVRWKFQRLFPGSTVENLKAAATTDSMQQHARPTMVEDVERNLNEILKYGDN